MLKGPKATNVALCNALSAPSPRAANLVPPPAVPALTAPRRVPGAHQRVVSPAHRRATPCPPRRDREAPLPPPTPGSGAFPNMHPGRRRRSSHASPRRRPPLRSQCLLQRPSQPLAHVLRKPELHHPPTPVVPRLALIPDQQQCRDQ